MNYTEVIQNAAIAATPSFSDGLLPENAAIIAVDYAEALADELVKRGLLEPAKPVESAPAKITEADIVVKAVFKDQDGDITVIDSVDNQYAKYLLITSATTECCYSTAIHIDLLIMSLNNASAIRIA